MAKMRLLLRLRLVVRWIPSFCAVWAIFCLVDLSVGRTVVLSEGGWLMVLLGHTFGDFKNRFNIVFSIVCLCSW